MTKHLFWIAIAGLLLAASCGDKDKKETTGPDEAAPDTVTGPGHTPSQTETDTDTETKPETGAEDGQTDGDIRGEEVTYTHGDTTMKGYLAWDPGIERKRPGILVVHEWWGHNEYARKRARMLAEMGYTALALDMYGEGKNTTHPEDAKKFMTAVMSNMDEGVARFRAAKQLLEEHETTDADEISAIGYCFGGAVVLHMARIGMDLDGVASFHGNLDSPVKAEKGKVKAKVLVLHGAADPFVPDEKVEAFEKEMEQAGVDLELHAYEGAKHAFTNPGATELGDKNDLPLEYNQEADEKSWAELEQFLEGLYGE